MISLKRLALVSMFGVLIGVNPSAAIPIFDFTGSGAASVGSAGRTGTVGWSFTLSIPMTVEALGGWDDGHGSQTSQTVGLWTSGGALLSSAIVGESSTPAPSSSSTGQWLFTSVTPFVLSPGDYVLSSLYNTLSSSSDGVRIVSPPAITLETVLAGATERVADAAELLLPVAEELATSYVLSDPRTIEQAVIELRPDTLQDPSTTGFTTIPGVTYNGGRSGAGGTLTFPTLTTTAAGFGPNLSVLADPEVHAVPEPFALAFLSVALVGFVVRH
jgi:hypothetical protein